MTGAPPVALLTYSTRPRGGVVHTLHLAEALRRLGAPVHLVTLGDPKEGFFRPTTVPHTVLPAPAGAGSLEEKVFRSIDLMADYLAAAGPFKVLHAQDCIAARAAVRARRTGVVVIRTVHHVDDFTTPALVECQRRSILDPDRVLVVSEHWRRVLREEFGVAAAVVTNGVDASRFRRPGGFDRSALRGQVGADGRFLWLAVGGIEPRKGSLELVEALALVREKVDPPPVLAVVGGHSFQDHAAYADGALGRAAELGLSVGEDVVLLGTVPDPELPGWYHAADALAFPSRKEGWGLAVLEALAAGLPVVASDIPVLREYLTDGETALLAPEGDPRGLADAMVRMATDEGLRARLGAAGPALAARFTWEACARRHLEVYGEAVAAGPGSRAR